MLILNRPPGDTFSLRLFYNLNRLLTPPFDSIYLWSSSIDPCIMIDDDVNRPSEPEVRKEIFSAIKEKVILIGIKDHLTSKSFNPWLEEMPGMITYLQDLFRLYSDKQFILLTSLENLDCYLKEDNLKIIPWGGCITNHQKEYLELDPILDKNLDSKHTFISLNRHARQSRCLLVSILYGLNLEKFGLTSCMFKDNYENFTDFVDWKFNKSQQDIKELAIQGFKNLKNSHLKITDNKDIYKTNWNNNVFNFKNSLVNYYSETFVEFVAETSYTEQCFNITEKTLNSIYGCNFPILISSKGTVDFLRSMGMDMFDDVVNHNYDQIENPIDRLYRAVTDNIELLTNVSNTKHLWVKYRDRFIKNIDFAKNKMYNFYSSRAENKLLEIKDELKL